MKIIVAENDRAEMEKIKGFLSTEADVQIIGEARDGKECLDRVTRLRPDIALIRQDLPVISGLDAAEQIAAQSPGVGTILIVSGNESPDVWRKMLQAGIKDFVTRPL